MLTTQTLSKNISTTDHRHEGTHPLEAKDILHDWTLGYYGHSETVMRGISPKSLKKIFSIWRFWILEIDTSSFPAPQKIPSPPARDQSAQ